MSIGRNFFLGREPVRGFGPFRWLAMRTIARQTRESLADVGINIRSAKEKVGKLSGGERQSIAIGRAVHFGAKLLILEEPTSALSVAESRKVLDYTLNAKPRGLSVIFITHNPHHAYPVGDHFIVLRRGRILADYRKVQVNQDELVSLMD